MSMGPNVNSNGFEISPFLSENNDTLYYASNGFGGEGDSDIFYSLRTGESWSDWSEPINIGPMINSAKFDAYFTISDHFFYWSSNRDDMRSDIYYSTFLPPPPLFASAVGSDVTVYQGSDGKIDLTPSGGVPPYSYLWSNGSTDEDPEELIKGIYTVVVTDDVDQEVEVEVPINEPDPIPEIRTIETVKIVEEAIIYFDLNSSIHNSENAGTLKDFVGKFSSKSDVKLSVESHCDRRDSDSYNIWLSKKRMNRTIDYLVSNGFNRDLITGSYKGERQPDVVCKKCTEEQFTKNRRTIIKVIE
jgi:outer membrane protein OmpA-like peptidoglycan-associated protein